jgi:hypothetical protein
MKGEHVPANNESFIRTRATEDLLREEVHRAIERYRREILHGPPSISDATHGRQEEFKVCLRRFADLVLRGQMPLDHPV